MNQRIKIKWADALRSGDYKQGFENLKIQKEGERTCYCALGVLVELFHAETGQGEWVPTTWGSFKFKFADRADGCEPLPIVMQWAELDNADPIAGADDGWHVSVIAMNDSKRWPFERIAETIENSTLL